MPLSANDIQSIIKDAIPDFEASEQPKQIEGGNLNYVWRIPGRRQNLIAKFAPPYIAANPDVPMNPKRIEFEARALTQFQQDQALYSIASDSIRPPKFRFYAPKKHLLLMENCGDLPDIAKSLNMKKRAVKLGETLGTFIGQLHKKTYNKEGWQTDFNNIDIQETRLEVQYKSAGEYAGKGGVPEISKIQERTEVLGHKLLQPGKCLVMGDLWPPSILIHGNNIRLIDWEFVHYGRPLQDVGHFAAHCWMQTHTSSPKNSNVFKTLWENFWDSYQLAVQPLLTQLFDDAEYRDMSTHIGAEILVRATGPFKNGYVYQELDPSHSKIQQAVLKARQMILAKDCTPLWNTLS